MKRLAALGALATLTMLAGCATGDGYYRVAYGYGYPVYNNGPYIYGDGYVAYPNDFSYPGYGNAYYGYGGYRGAYHYYGRPSSPAPGGIVGPQARIRSPYYWR